MIEREFAGRQASARRSRWRARILCCGARPAGEGGGFAGWTLGFLMARFAALETWWDYVGADGRLVVDGMFVCMNDRCM